MSETHSGGERSGRLLSPRFQPAAAYLLAGSPRLPGNVEFIRVDDADVGPILTHPEDGVVGHTIRTTKSWEPGEGRFLRSILRPGMNVLDVGAYIGYFTLLFGRAVGPTGRVLAVEAEPDAFGVLRANVALAGLDNVDLLPAAAHRDSGLISITRNPFNPGSSTTVYQTQDWKSSFVQAVRLDDVLEPAIPIHVIKIDVEGLDHAVVEGLERTLRQWNPIVLLEFNPGWIDRLGERPDDVLRRYREIGREVRVLGGDAIRLHRDAGMDIEILLQDELLVTAENAAALIDATRRIYYINLILLPERRWPGLDSLYYTDEQRAPGAVAVGDRLS